MSAKRQLCYTINAAFRIINLVFFIKKVIILFRLLQRHQLEPFIKAFKIGHRLD
jgi:hypothetical protein